LGLVQDGDLIELNVSKRTINLLVDEKELAKRREHFAAPPLPQRGWKRLYAQHVQQAPLGADMDFL